MSPDPYDGSYDFTNPQSFNRYTYAGNKPLSLTDLQGLDDGPGYPGVMTTRGETALMVPLGQTRAVAAGVVVKLEVPQVAQHPPLINIPYGMNMEAFMVPPIPAS